MMRSPTKNMTATRQIVPMALLATVLCATGLPLSGCDDGGGPDDAYTKPPFVEGAAFCANFNRNFVEAIPEPVKYYIYDAQVCGGEDFHRLYDGRLRRWVEDELKDATDDELAAGLRERIQNSFSESRRYLRRRLPDLPDDQLLLAHVCHLTHGHFQFAFQMTPRHSARQLIELEIGDCSELADLCGVLISLVDERAKVAMLLVHYETDIGLFHASHAIVATDGSVIDPTINMILTKTFEQMKAMPPAQRFEALMASGDVHLGYNRYLEPKHRKPQIEQHNTDAGVLAFYYPWYLDGLTEPDSSITYRDLPPQVRFAKAPGTKTKDTKAR